MPPRLAPVGKQAPPTRAAPSLVRALRDARGPLLFATGTSLSQRRCGGPFCMPIRGPDCTPFDSQAPQRWRGVVAAGASCLHERRPRDEGARRLYLDSRRHANRGSEGRVRRLTVKASSDHPDRCLDGDGQLRKRNDGSVGLFRKSGEFPLSNEELDDAAATVYEEILGISCTQASQRENHEGASYRRVGGSWTDPCAVVNQQRSYTCNSGCSCSA